MYHILHSLVTLRELIFTGINFRFFRGFSAKLENLNPRNTIFAKFIEKFEKPLGEWKKFVQKRAKPWKLIPAKYDFYEFFFDREN